MISLTLLLIFVAIYIIPVDQIRSAYIGLALIAVLGGLEVLGLISPVAISSNPATTYTLITVLGVTLFASVKKGDNSKSIFLDPLGVLAYLALLEFGLVSELTAFKFSLIVTLLFTSQKKMKKFYKILIALAGMLSVNLYFNQLMGPIEPELLEQSLSNLVLFRYFDAFLNLFYTISLIVIGIKSLVDHEDSFLMCLFLLVNLYFSPAMIAPVSYYFSFSVILLYALKNQSLNLFSILQVLLTLLFFRFAQDDLVLFSSLFLCLELVKNSQFYILDKLESMNSNFLMLGFYLIIFSLSSLWPIRISVLFALILCAVYIENKEKWVLK